MGLSGLGDLVLTCTSRQSRNLSLGVALAEGAQAAEYLAQRKSVAEGAYTAAAVVALAHRHAIDMPIAGAVEAILHRGAAIETTIGDLLARPFKVEANGPG
jgi:glycerol-3-phosphate dehydrogenase (NAD(P)+)